jgi:predicted nucleotidyltransferase
MAASSVDVLVAGLRENRTRIGAAGIRRLMLFGSFARGDDRADVF